MKFSDRYLKSLKPREKRYLVWEDGVHGLGNLGVRVTPTGRRSWIFMYRSGGKARMLTLGKYPAMSVAEAHEIASGHQARIDVGEDPAAPVADSEAVSVARIGADYLKRRLKPGRTQKEFRRILEREVYPSWQGRSAASIQRREVVTLVDAIAERPAPVMANRTLAVIKAMFNFAIRRGQVDANPASLIPMKQEEARPRHLEDKELVTLFEKLPEAPLAGQTKLSLLATLASVQRPGEAVAVEAKELVEHEDWWTIPPEKRKVGPRGRGRGKPLTRHGVPMSPALLAVFKAADAMSWSDRWVFPSSRTESHIRGDSLAKGVRRCAEHFGLKHWTPHDLRRTGATNLAKLGFDRTVLGKLLGHKKTDESVTAIYDQYTYDAEKVAALDAWSERLIELGFMDAVKAIAG